MDSQIEEIKSKLNIIDVISGYLKLTKTGANFRGVCPFHPEKSPSFFVSPTRQMWHCFGCGAGSSLFDFIMKIEGIEFSDALKILANKAGVQLKRENVQARSERQRLQEVCELACKFFEKQLDASLYGQKAREYLLGRGITAESIKAWRLGYAPDTWQGLSDFLVGKGFERKEVVMAGLAIEKENNRSDSYDRFRGRIMFPVFGINGEVLGFGGRVFKEAQKKEVAKYINTPQTLLYNKSGILYGLHKGKVAVRKQNQCVVTEGYTDVIMCHQAGFENTVASSGTALTEQHLIILKRYTENLVLAFDMDVAGDNATKRGINLAQTKGFNIKIVEAYGQGDKKSDPADIILKSPAIWQESVEKAKSIMDYYVDSAFARINKDTPEGKKQIGNIVLPAIKRISNTIEQSHWIQVLSHRLGIGENAILQELEKVTIEKSEAIETEIVTTPVAEIVTISGVEKRKQLIEEKVISLILKNPDYALLLGDEHYELFSPKIAEFLRKLSIFIKEKKPVENALTQTEVATLFDQMLQSEALSQDTEFQIDLKHFLATLAIKAEVDYKDDGEDEVKLCLAELQKIALKQKTTKMIVDITNEADLQKKEDLTRQFDKDAKKFHSI